RTPERAFYLGVFTDQPQVLSRLLNVDFELSRRTRPGARGASHFDGMLAQSCISSRDDRDVHALLAGLERGVGRGDLYPFGNAAEIQLHVLVEVLAPADADRGGLRLTLLDADRAGQFQLERVLWRTDPRC